MCMCVVHVNALDQRFYYSFVQSSNTFVQVCANRSEHQENKVWSRQRCGQGRSLLTPGGRWGMGNMHQIELVLAYKPETRLLSVHVLFTVHALRPFPFTRSGYTMLTADSCARVSRTHFAKLSCAMFASAQTIGQCCEVFWCQLVLFLLGPYVVFLSHNMPLCCICVTTRTVLVDQ